MAKFTVTTHDDGVAHYEGTYAVDEGVLTVLQAEGSGNKILFSPSGWLTLQVTEEDPPVT